MRYRDVKEADLARARAAVGEWRDSHPEGTSEAMLAELGAQFDPDYQVILRGMLFRTDRDRGRTVRAAVRLVLDEGEQRVRLALFRSAHPEVAIGRGEFRTWEARIREPDGVRYVVVATLRELMDRLDVLFGPPR
jgi:hypothetical protein